MGGRLFARKLLSGRPHPSITAGTLREAKPAYSLLLRRSLGLAFPWKGSMRFRVPLLGKTPGAADLSPVFLPLPPISLSYPSLLEWRLFLRRRVPGWRFIFAGAFLQRPARNWRLSKGDRRPVGSRKMLRQFTRNPGLPFLLAWPRIQPQRTMGLWAPGGCAPFTDYLDGISLPGNPDKRTGMVCRNFAFTASATRTATGIADAKDDCPYPGLQRRAIEWLPGQRRGWHQRPRRRLPPIAGLLKGCLIATATASPTTSTNARLALTSFRTGCPPTIATATAS